MRRGVRDGRHSLERITLSLGRQRPSRGAPNARAVQLWSGASSINVASHTRRPIGVIQ